MHSNDTRRETTDLRQGDELPALRRRPVAPGAVGYAGRRRTAGGILDRNIILYPQRDGFAALPWSWRSG